MRAPRTLFALCMLSCGVAAQGLDEVRDEFRNALQAARFPAFIASLVDLTEENELSAATYRINDPFRTKVSTIKLPYRTTFDVGERGYGVYVEGNLGYLSATGDNADLFSGEVPELATSVDAEWSVYSALAGVGASIPIAEGFDLTPILDLSVAYIESDATYGGPGAPLGPVLFDRLLFNWNAWVLTYGPALRLDWELPLSEEVALETVARYDLRRSDTLRSSDSVQDGVVTSQRFTLRGDVVGPTPVHIGSEAMRWRATLAYTWFPGETGDALGFDSFVEFGGALELPLGDSIPVVSELTLSGGLIYGRNVQGWTLGVGASF